MAILLSASQDAFVVLDYSKILDWKSISAIQKSGAGKFPECNEPAVNQQLLQQDARLYRQVGSGIYKNSDTGVFVGAYDWQGDTRDCQDCEEVSFSSQSWQIPWSISPLHCRRNLPSSFKYSSMSDTLTVTACCLFRYSRISCLVFVVYGFLSAMALSPSFKSFLFIVSFYSGRVCNESGISFKAILTVVFIWNNQPLHKNMHNKIHSVISPLFRIKMLIQKPDRMCRF